MGRSAFFVVLTLLLLSSPGEAQIKSRIVFPVQHFDATGKLDWVLSCTSWSQEGDVCRLKEAVLKIPVKGLTVRAREAFYFVESKEVRFQFLEVKWEKEELIAKSKSGTSKVGEKRMNMTNCSFIFGEVKGKGKHCVLRGEEKELELEEGVVEVKDG